MDFLSLLKQLSEKVGSNLDASGNMINQQTSLAGKQMDDPNYQPTQDELNNQNKYYDAVNGAVAGSMNAGGIRNNANAAKSTANYLFDAAAENPMEANPNLLTSAQQAMSRGVDAAERYKNQLQQAKAAALAKLRGQ